ncbi:Na-translocating system protein MpsC family protein [Marinococcus halotolerans]|uniref:Na-translocating system protein MpsC family protein n=1 Tax=Marinococcus halotolerans TaxID=301092 RepID=UPI0003B512B6|nr:Na-translocating system protein MpsC family protein [Marinococcus halotolerans]
MEETQAVQGEMAGYIGKLIRNHFGKGPTSVYVSLEHPFLVIRLRDFLASMESILVAQGEYQRVEDTRGLIFKQLQGEMRARLETIAGITIQEMYFDWDLQQQRGVILGVMSQDASECEVRWPKHLNHRKFNEQVIELSKWGQKVPATTESFWLNDRTIVIKRTGIFVEIEKELIRAGYTNELQKVKKPLELRMIHRASLESFLDSRITGTFVSWHFTGDKGYALLILQPKKQ